MVGGQDYQLREEFLTNSKNEIRDDESQKDDNCKGSNKSNRGADDSKSKSGRQQEKDKIARVMMEAKMIAISV